MKAPSGAFISFCRRIVPRVLQPAAAPFTAQSGWWEACGPAPSRFADAFVAGGEPASAQRRSIVGWCDAWRTAAALVGFRRRFRSATSGGRAASAFEFGCSRRRSGAYGRRAASAFEFGFSRRCPRPPGCRAARRREECRSPRRASGVAPGPRPEPRARRRPGAGRSDRTGGGRDARHAAATSPPRRRGRTGASRWGQRQARRAGGET
jgi:hypothetical protein